MNKRAFAKYAMGIDMQTTKRHPGYSASLSAEANYKKGLAYARAKGISKPHLWVGRSLGQLANLTGHKVFNEASEMGYTAYRKKRVRA